MLVHIQKKIRQWRKISVIPDAKINKYLKAKWLWHTL